MFGIELKEMQGLKAGCSVGYQKIKRIYKTSLLASSYMYSKLYV